MAIEFRCTQCGRLLRTGDDTAGKPAQCPECSAITTVPVAGASASPPSDSTPGSPFASGGGSSTGSGGGSPFGPGGPQPGQPGETENPYQSPTQYGAAPVYSPLPGPITPTQIDIGDVFTRTWEIFKGQWAMCLGALAIVVVVNVAVSFGLGFAESVIARITRDHTLATMVGIFGNFASSLFGTWLGIGQALFFLKTARGQPASFNDIFSGGPYFVSILVGSILVGLATFVGFLLCIVPGIIFALMFSQFYYLILDRNMGAFDALGYSSELMKGNKLTLFLIGLVSGLAGIAIVVFTCGLGLLVVAPYLALLHPVIYLAITGQPTADRLRGAH